MTDNLTQLFLARAAERPDLRIGTLDEQLALPDALRRAAGGAQRLRDLGLNDQHRLAIVATSSTDYLVVWLACVLSGVPVALVNPTYPPELLAQMLDNLDPALVFTDLPDHCFAGSPADAPLAAEPGVARRRPGRHPGIRRRPVRPGRRSCTPPAPPVCPKFCAQTHSYFLRLGRAIADAHGADRPGPGARPAADVPYQPARLRHRRRPHRRRRRADRRASSPPAGSGRTSKSMASRRCRCTRRPWRSSSGRPRADDAAGHQVRVDLLRRRRLHDPLPHPARGVLLRLHRGGRGQPPAPVAARVRTSRRTPAATAAPPGPTSRTGWTPTGRSSSGNASPAPCSPATSPAERSTRPATTTAGSPPATSGATRRGTGGLRFLERAAESIRVKGEFVPIPFVEERLGTIPELVDLALWKKPGELVDDEVVLYAVADSAAGRRRSDRCRKELPAFMRPTLRRPDPRHPPRRRRRQGAAPAAARPGGAVVDHR